MTDIVVLSDCLATLKTLDSNEITSKLLSISNALSVHSLVRFGWLYV